MSKVNLKNYEELVVSDEIADFVTKELESKRTAEFPLYHYPLAISHTDGMWSGTLNDIASVSSSSKKVNRIKWFENVNDIDSFHNLYGYGAYKSEYIKGYGSLDVKTKFLIKIGKAQLVDKSLGKQLVMIQWKDKHKEQSWSDLWEIYEKNLDAFGDLLEPNKRICKIME